MVVKWSFDVHVMISSLSRVRRRPTWTGSTLCLDAFLTRSPSSSFTRLRTSRANTTNPFSMLRYRSVAKCDSVSANKQSSIGHKNALNNWWKSISVKMFHLGKWSQTFDIMNTRQDPLPTERFREKTERNRSVYGGWMEWEGAIVMSVFSLCYYLHSWITG